jgi:steroid 5-alpha reductase family enzyme
MSLILLLFFDMKSNYEEEKLKEKFPGYTLYQNGTGKFTPPFFKSKS